MNFDENRCAVMSAVLHEKGKAPTKVAGAFRAPRGACSFGDPSHQNRHAYDPPMCGRVVWSRRTCRGACFAAVFTDERALALSRVVEITRKLSSARLGGCAPRVRFAGPAGYPNAFLRSGDQQLYHGPYLGSTLGQGISIVSWPPDRQPWAEFSRYGASRAFHRTCALGPRG